MSFLDSWGCPSKTLRKFKMSNIKTIFIIKHKHYLFFYIIFNDDMKAMMGKNACISAQIKAVAVNYMAGY